jgi:hypothetical protein
VLLQSGADPLVVGQPDGATALKLATYVVLLFSTLFCHLFCADVNVNMCMIGRVNLMK